MKRVDEMSIREINTLIVYTLFGDGCFLSPLYNNSHFINVIDEFRGSISFAPYIANDNMWHVVVSKYMEDGTRSVYSGVYDDYDEGIIRLMLKVLLREPKEDV